MSVENIANTAMDDWLVSCSDDELLTEGENWCPSPSELESLYEEIEKQGILELEWRCPGRRPPSPIKHDETSDHSDLESNNEEKLNNFEFMDELSSPQMRVRVGGETELKGSAKKKTSSFDGILKNIRRHHQLNQRIDNKVSDVSGLKNTQPD